MRGERPQVQRDGRYRPGDTAKMLGVSRRTLERWVEAGKIQRRYTVECRPVFLGRDILALWDKMFALMDF